MLRCWGSFALPLRNEITNLLGNNRVIDAQRIIGSDVDNRMPQFLQIRNNILFHFRRRMVVSNGNPHKFHPFC